ncbi:MAG: pyruvoyl-dependent arginine decarboxylase [Nanoarchaeota archaeon]
MTEFYVPEKVFFTNGVGIDKDKLTSFELALRDAKIFSYNLIKVSSILPPKCKEISRDEGIKYFHEGEEVCCVLSENSTNENHRLIAASIGIANPLDEATHGYISEYHSFGEKDEDVGEYAEKIAIGMFASGKGFSFDKDNFVSEKNSRTYKVGDYTLRTRNVKQSSLGKEGVWTTVVAAAVFIPYDPKIKELESKLNIMESRLSILENYILISKENNKEDNQLVFTKNNSIKVRP